MPRLREQLLLNQNVVRVEQYDEELVILKNHIHEDFYNNHLVMVFNALGQYEFREAKQV